MSGGVDAWLAPTEDERVEAWRLEELLRAGYSLTDATSIAECVDVDLHRAVALLEQGCPPTTAVRILV